MANISSDTAMSEEGILLWKQHFASKPDNLQNTLSVQIPVSWFNFIIHLLMTPDKFGWTIHMLKSPLWELLTSPDKPEDSITFYIPDKCQVSQPPVCQHAATDNQEKHTEGDSSNQEGNMEQALLLPFGADNTRKRRGGKTPLVVSEVRRSDRISKEDNGFKRNSCFDNKCLPCNVIPLVAPKKVIKNLTKSFCKIAEEELENKLNKKQKRKSQEDLTKVSMVKEKENSPKAHK